MHRLIYATGIAALLAGCTVVIADVSGDGNQFNTDIPTASADNGGSAVLDARRDPTINAAIPWWTP